MRKYAFSLLLVLVLVFGLLPMTAQAEALDNGLVYEVYDDHVEITDYTGDATEVVIPAEIEGLPVTALGKNAFTNNSNLVSIDLPNSITSIGMYTFYGCSSLTRINLSDNITTFGKYAFCNCTSLISISIPEGVASISDSTFANCSSLTEIQVDENNPCYSSDDRGVLFDKGKTKLILAPDAITGSYEIPDGVTSIGENAFDDCIGLNNVYMPDSLVSIGEYAFQSCCNLTSIDLSDSLISIGDKVFYECTGLTSIVLPAGVTSIGEQTFEGCANLTNVAMPENLTSIGKWAFYECSSLTDIDLPDSLADIGARAFAYCTSLTSITIPEGVTEIGGYAFQSCTSLTGIHVDDNNLYYSSDERGVLFDKEKAELIQAPGAIAGSYAIPAGVTDISWQAFENCSSLTAIEIPEGITETGCFTFAGCTNLTTVNLPDSLINIDDGAFAYCSSLTSIYIPQNVTNISDGYGMYDESAFAYCSSLTGIHVDDNNLYYSSDERGVLFDKEKVELIQAPGAIAGSYVVPDGVSTIGDWAFFERTGLTSINLPDSLASIGYQAFLDCPNLTGIYAAENNLHYSSDDRGVLFNKDKTKLIQVPEAIAGSYVMPDGVVNIGRWAFAGCERLIDVIIPDTVTSIGYGAFVLCKNLTSITIPNSVASIDDFAFESCESLTSIIFRGDAPEFGDGTFYEVKATAYYPAGNDTWTEDVMPYYGTTITWIPYTPSPFNDAAIGSFYYDPVLWAVENGITTGATATSFNPNGTCLRAQVVTFLHRADGNPEPTSSKNPFTDVKSGDFFYKPVLWAVEKGITNGVDATTFGSYANCNRAAVVTFLWRAAGSPEPESTNNPFVDVKTTDFFYKPVLWAVENGITNGVDATHFGPAADCNRAQVVTFLYRAFSEQ